MMRPVVASLLLCASMLACSGGHNLVGNVASEVSDAGSGNPNTGGGGGGSGGGGGGGGGGVTAASCAGSGDSLTIGGDDYIHTGPALTLSDGTWLAQVTQTQNGVPSYVSIIMSDATHNWSLDFSTDKLGVPLAPGTYNDAQRAAFADQGHAGLDVGGDGKGCNTVTGSFSVGGIQYANDDAGAPVITSFSASFVQHCEGDATKSNTGCVKFVAAQ